MDLRWSIPQQSQKQVQSIVCLHLARFRDRRDFTGAKIRDIYPLLDHKGEAGTFFEVVFSSAGHNSHGFAIVSTSRCYPPVVVFAFEGIAPRDYFISHLGHREFNVALYGTFHLVAENEHGQPMATLGCRPHVLCAKPRIPPDELKGLTPYEVFKKCYGLLLQKFLEQTKGHFDHLWKSVDMLRQGGESSGQPSDYPTSDADLPPHNYEEVLATHWKSMPHYGQIDPNEGANQDHDFHSGCGATAWMNLIGYYDNTLTPDLLRGNYDGDSVGASDYQDHVQVALSEYIGTHADGDIGKVDWDDERKGFGFIEERLNHSIEQSINGQGYSALQTLQTVYDYLSYAPGVPSIVALSDHYVVAYGVMINLDGATGDQLSTSDHYLKVNWGRGPGTPDVYIPYDLAENGVWSLGQIDTCSEVTVDGSFSIVPTFADLGRFLMMGSRSEHHINFHASEDGRFFNYRGCIPSIGTSNPALVVEPGGKYLYVAWSNSDGTLGLAKMDANGTNLKMLQAPSDQTPNSGPALAIHCGRLYYVWGGNIASIPLDWLERYASNIWPSGPGETLTIAGEQSEWRIWDMYESVGSPGSFTQPTLVEHVSRETHKEFDGPHEYVNSRLYLGTTGFRNGQLVSKAWLLDDHGNVTLDHSGAPVETTCGHKLCSFGESLYGCDDSTIWKIQPMDLAGMGANPQLHSREFLWPYGIDSENVVLGGFETVTIFVHQPQVNLGPCLFSSWLDSNQVLHIRYHSVNTFPSLDMTGWIM